MKYTIAIALFVAPFYTVLSSMPATASISNQDRSVCSTASKLAVASATRYQMNISVQKTRQVLLESYSKDGNFTELESWATEWQLKVMRSLYSGDTYMPQVLHVWPDMADRLIKQFGNRIYARCVSQ